MIPPRHILVIAEGQLGDLILLTPALRAFRESFRGVRVTALVVQRRRYGDSARDLICVNPRGGTTGVLAGFVDDILEVDRSRLRDLRGLSRLAAEAAIVRGLRRLRCDAAVCTFPQDRFLLWARASGARRRVGQSDQPLRFLLTDRPALRKEEGGVLRYYAGLAEALGARPRSYRTEVQVTEAHRRRAEAVLTSHGISLERPIVAIHPGASGPFNVWPPERFAALADSLGRATPAGVFLCGSLFDREPVEFVRRSLRAALPVIEFGEDVLDTAAVFERCSVVVANNSGPWHLALASGAACLVLMSKYRERAWHVYGDEPQCLVLQGEQRCPVCPDGECHDLVPPGERFGTTCLRMISVLDAVDGVTRLLALPQRRAERYSS